MYLQHPVNGIADVDGDGKMAEQPSVRPPECAVSVPVYPVEQVVQLPFPRVDYASVEKPFTVLIMVCIKQKVTALH